MEKGFFASQIPVEKVRGLKPSVWVCVGAGFAREDAKAVLLSQGQGFVAEAITTLEEIALRVTGLPAAKLLDSTQRQEVLRLLLSEPKISAQLPELKRLRRQSSFFRRLDFAIQAGRMAASHPQEEEVYAERLLQRFGENPVRNEVRALSRAYEAWLTASTLVDPPRLISLAIDLFPEQEVTLPEEILLFSVQSPESLEKTFWETLESKVRVRRCDFPQAEKTPRIVWERWHTTDDACDRLAEELARKALNDHAILIAEHGGVRRSVKRALREWGIPEADPRDPTRLQWDEEIKWATLPLELVARAFERDAVISWVRMQNDETFRRDAARWSAEIANRGIRLGLKAYAGGNLVALHEQLQELERKFAGKKRCEEIATAHLDHLRRLAPQALADAAGIFAFFEAIWKQMVADMALLGLADRRAPLLYWVERLQERISQAPAPVARQKPQEGIRLYRLQQAPLLNAKTVWIVGLPSQWLAGEGVGDYWLGERDRETLAAEFAVRSGAQVREERLAVLKAWFTDAETVHILDAQYDADGRERESILPVLRELGFPDAPEAPSEHGSQDRWRLSYGALRPLPPQEVQLEPLFGGAGGSGGAAPEISATTVDRLSRCSFQSLALDRWKVRDLREPDCELWPDIRGNILHEAVKILLRSRDAEGSFGMSPGDALERAWKTKPPKGLVRSRALEGHLRSRLVRVLEDFCEKEREYFRRSGARVVCLDDRDFHFSFGDFGVVGTPDRIDEVSEGLFIMDYKSSGAMPNGTDMLEKGYRLQLPFYALAASSELKKPALGVQFIELKPKGSRGSGIFFKRFNGKDPGKLTNARSNSKSLLQSEPEETWGRLRDAIEAQSRAYLAGRFEARAKKPEKDCQNCAVSDLCGYRRRLSDGLENEAESESGEGA